MFNPDLKKLLKGCNSRYSLVVGTAKRAREIREEAIEREETAFNMPEGNPLGGRRSCREANPAGRRHRGHGGDVEKGEYALDLDHFSP